MATVSSPMQLLGSADLFLGRVNFNRHIIYLYTMTIYHKTTFWRKHNNEITQINSTEYNLGDFCSSILLYHDYHRVCDWVQAYKMSFDKNSEHTKFRIYTTHISYWPNIFYFHEHPYWPNCLLVDLVVVND